MNAHLAWPGLALFLLGAGHGLNPGMGWLFAVALGLQEGRARAVWRALGPLALGHALAVLLALAAALALGAALPAALLKLVVGTMLVGLGLARLRRHRHPRVGGMRVGMGALTMWSLLMATAHGAGLMVVPVAMAGGLGARGPHAGHAMHQAAMAGGGSEAALVAALLHTAGYLLVTATLALLVYWKFGLRLLNRAWVNLDLVWAVALVVTGVVALLA